jgi:hypothetical protein
MLCPPDFQGVFKFSRIRAIQLELAEIVVLLFFIKISKFGHAPYVPQTAVTCDINIPIWDTRAMNKNLYLLALKAETRADMRISTSALSWISWWKVSFRHACFSHWYSIPGSSPSYGHKFSSSIRLSVEWSPTNEILERRPLMAEPYRFLESREQSSTSRTSLFILAHFFSIWCLPRPPLLISHMRQTLSKPAAINAGCYWPWSECVQGGKVC